MQWLNIRKNRKFLIHENNLSKNRLTYKNVGPSNMNNIPTSYYSPEYNVKGKASEKAQMNMSKSLLKDPVKPNSKILDS